ncbi:MAG: NADH-quinone oxidoreductase subunit M [Gemmataceae bacterium]|nr:NADH-quinone oxidoreductase subunit M [Gemmataceae bacterium]
MDGTSLMMIALVALPIAAAIAIAALGSRRVAQARVAALGVSLVGLVLSLILAWQFHQHRAEHPPALSATPTFAPEMVPGADPANPHKTTWNILELGRSGAVQFYIGLDGLNVWLVVLTGLLMVPAVLVSWNAIEDRANEYYAWLLVLGAGLMGVFLAFDLILFYVFFELTLVPLFFLIGIWGGPERRHAARKFFIYTLAGSLITFVGLLAVVVVVWQRSGSEASPRTLTFSIPELIAQVNMHLRIPAEAAFWQRFQVALFLALFAGFAIKVPLFPMHTWLPLAHVEAPTAGSVLLAGVLLKMGTYGFLRLALPLAPDACITLGVPMIGTLAVVGILYGAFCSLAQDDIKKLIAYSSVSHLGFCMLGMFALNETGITGSMLQMINHGISTGGLFLIVGMLYERYHTRKIADYSGIGAKLYLLSAAMVFVCLSSVGLPGLNGFVGEALVFFGMFKVRPTMAVIGTAGILLGAWYLLSMLKAVFFGPLKEPGHSAHHGQGHSHGHGHAHGNVQAEAVGKHEGSGVQDITGREVILLAPILALCLVLGVFPQPIINSMQPDVRVVSTILEQRKEALRKAVPAPVETKTAEAQR